MTAKAAVLQGLARPQQIQGTVDLFQFSNLKFISHMRLTTLPEALAIGNLADLQSTEVLPGPEQLLTTSKLTNVFTTCVKVLKGQQMTSGSTILVDQVLLVKQIVVPLFIILFGDGNCASCSTDQLGDLITFFF